MPTRGQSPNNQRWAPQGSLSLGTLRRKSTSYPQTLQPSEPSCPDPAALSSPQILKIPCQLAVGSGEGQRGGHSTYPVRAALPLRHQLMPQAGSPGNGHELAGGSESKAAGRNRRRGQLWFSGFWLG